MERFTIVGDGTAGGLYGVAIILVGALDPCDYEGVYDPSQRPIHIGAIFILLVTSLVATTFPLLAQRVPWLGVPKFGILIGWARFAIAWYCIGAGKHIGT